MVKCAWASQKAKHAALTGKTNSAQVVNACEPASQAMSASVDTPPLSTAQDLCLALEDEQLFQLFVSLLRTRPRVAERLESESLARGSVDRETTLERTAKQSKIRLPVSSGDSSCPEDEEASPRASEIRVTTDDQADADELNVSGRVLSVAPEKTGTVVSSKRKTAHQRQAGGIMAGVSSYCAPMLNSKLFVASLVTSVVIALFGGSVVTLANIPDDPGLQVMDTIMTLVTVIFVIELVLNCIVNWKTYPLSIFFWMDLVGTASMILEISFLLGMGGKIQEASSPIDTVFMRAARAAKVGARAGRVSKFLKYFEKKDTQNETSEVEAKVLSRKLTLVLSTRVSVLTIMLAIVIPLFQIGEFPEVDLAMDTWARSLEAGYEMAYDAAEMTTRNSVNSTAFQVKVTDLIDYYGIGSDQKYEPFKLQGWEREVMINGATMEIPGQNLLQKPFPPRMSNVMFTELRRCLIERPACRSRKDDEKVGIYWDLQVARQHEAIMDIGLIIFITASMVAISIILSYTLDNLVIRPLERMLTTVMKMAGDILQQFGVDPAVDADEVEETTLIEGIFKRFARLAALAAERNEVTEEELQGMDNATQGVMLEIMEIKKGPRATVSASEVDAESSGPLTAISKLSMDPSVVDSWQFDVLEYKPEDNTQAAIHLFFDSRLGRTTGRKWTPPKTFVRFHSDVRASYGDLPYHNYAHAIDVLHTVYRLLTITASSRWMSSVEQYALLVAALCHDLGHQGKTNQFLVEVKHQLALTYNDKSPLENMHAAKLFEICSKRDSDIFSGLDPESTRLARKVSIAAILHTDNINHFDMIKNISRTYEIMSDVCEDQALCGEEEMLSSYEEQVLKKNIMQWIELFLHFADVSNPLKPFKICKAWAWRVLDEFFDQGDEEKKLGIPVGMLNDRAKINRPGSQHGFINFMVAPLVFSTVQLFPALHPLYAQMADNLESWRHLWIEDAKPSPEEIAKKDADVTKVKDNASMLSSRIHAQRASENASLLSQLI